MTTQTRQDSPLREPASNEAAERLVGRLELFVPGDKLKRLQLRAEIRRALAAERRATVERIAAIIAAHGFGHAMPMNHDDWRDGESAFDHIRRHLDEEAAR